MYNLHCHSLLSDGVLLPSEVAVRYAALGYKVIAITDHVDYSNIDFVISAIRKFTQHWPKAAKIKVLPGIELTHLPLEQFRPLAKYGRKQGIKIIVGHGESPVEPVIIGTNRAALESDIDILAHPGLITDEDVRVAKKKKVFLELTCRHGHSKTNAYVAKKALKLGAPLIINTDSHAPGDIIPVQKLKSIALSAGLTKNNLNRIFKETRALILKKERKCN